MLNENKHPNKCSLRPWDVQRIVPSQVENVTGKETCLAISVVRLLFLLGVLRTAQVDKCFIYVLDFFIYFFKELHIPCRVQVNTFKLCSYSSQSRGRRQVPYKDSFKDWLKIDEKVLRGPYSKHFDGSFKSHLNVYSLNNAGDDMENLHFRVTLCHLLQQLEEQPKDGLQILKQRE